MNESFIDWYNEETKKTLTQDYGAPVDDHILHAALGIGSEAGEILDALKKQHAYNKPIDKVNMIEEVGDVMWYVMLMCRALNVDLETVCRTNIEKLKARYPNQWNQEDALNRDLDKERKILEKNNE